MDAIKELFDWDAIIMASLVVKGLKKEQNKILLYFNKFKQHHLIADLSAIAIPAYYHCFIHFSWKIYS